MTLSRRDLEEGRMRSVYVEALGKHALTDEELSVSLTATLGARPKGAGWWVFAYGSLLWNPLFPFAEARRARLHGFHRRFCLWSLTGFPAIGLPIGFDDAGLPLGVQLAMRTNADDALLGVAAWCEHAFGFGARIAPIERTIA